MAPFRFKLQTRESQCLDCSAAYGVRWIIEPVVKNEWRNERLKRGMVDKTRITVGN